MDFNILSQPAAVVAPRLLGCLLVRELDGQTLTVKIVETEAYDQTDAASHSYKGQTPRTDVMFGPAGHLYVYFTYGMHYCCNIVTGEVGDGSAVLIRAVEPVSNPALLSKRRPAAKTSQELTNGPAKLCQALAIDRSLNGHDLLRAPLKLRLQAALPDSDITVAPRIGISQAKTMPWRFYITSSPYVSKDAVNR